MYALRPKAILLIRDPAQKYRFSLIIRKIRARTLYSSFEINRHPASNHGVNHMELPIASATVFSLAYATTRRF